MTELEDSRAMLRKIKDEWGAEIVKLRDKLAAAEALLARRPHLTVEHGHGDNELEREECARLGGACAK